MEHTLPEGRAVIEALHDLGDALGYSVQREHKVGQSAAVDLSWTAADSNDVPLFIFEVESTASTGLANNAVKVYGSPTSNLPRPLFFFHLVLKGSDNNERIRNAQTLWGQHNYRVYRVSDEIERSLLAAEILKQHRRVNRFLVPAALATALSDELWGGPSTVKCALKLAEEMRFDGPYLHDYAELARNDTSYLDLYVSRLRYLDELSVTADRKHLSREGYEGGPGDYIPGLFEIGLRIYSGDIPDNEGPRAFERWATSPQIGLRVIDSAFGLNRDYDGYVVGVAPIDYALTAALLTDHPASRDWVLQDLSNLVAGIRSSKLRPRYCVPASVWLAHLLCATRNSDGSNGRSSLDIDAMYADLQVYIDEAEGVPERLLTEPPRAHGDISEKPYWWDWPNSISLPSLEDLRAQTAAQLGKGHPDTVPADPVGLCLTSLVLEDVYEAPTQELIGVIYGQAQ